MSEDDADTSDDFGSLRFDVASRRGASPVVNRGLWPAIVVAAGLHAGVLLALLVVEQFRGFGDRDVAETSIAVEIVTAQALDRASPAETPGTAETTTRAAEAAAESPDARELATSAEPVETPDPAPTAIAEPEPEQPAPKAPADRDTAPPPNEIVTTAITPPTPTEASTPAKAADDAQQGGGPPVDGASATAPALAVVPAQGTGASAYGESIIETLRRRPPRPPANQRGTVVIAFAVGSDGRVAAARVKTSSGSGDLDKAALDIVRATRFPAPPATTSRADLTFEVPYIFR